VRDQDPATILKRIGTHIDKHQPPGVKVTVEPNPSMADPYLIPYDHPGNQAAVSVHKMLYGKQAYYAYMGGSIPVCGLFLKELGAYTVNFAFGLKDENIHGPDEFWRLKSFGRGQVAYGMLLEQLSQIELP
jgi:acetylornithine deacetylase/succinyl-diaminopimelate desuccinylase-like protein